MISSYREKNEIQRLAAQENSWFTADGAQHEQCDNKNALVCSTQVVLEYHVSRQLLAEGTVESIGFG